MSEVTEVGWKETLTEICQRLSKEDIKKLTKYLKFNRIRFDDKFMKDLPKKITEKFRFPESVSEVNHAMKEILEPYFTIQTLLHPFLVFIQEEEPNVMGASFEEVVVNRGLPERSRGAPSVSDLQKQKLQLEIDYLVAKIEKLKLETTLLGHKLNELPEEGN